jgi:hypothetical protein
VEGEGTIGKTAAIKWFKRFEDGGFDLEDNPHSDRPFFLDEEDLRAALEDEPSSGTCDLADELGVAQRPLSITCTSLILSTRSHDKILANSLKHKLYDVLKSAANCSTIRWTIGSGSAL